MSGHQHPASHRTNVRELDPDTLLLVVVGAHLEAELHDRPLAYDLCDRIRTWQQASTVPDPLRPVVLTDMWYLNQAELRVRPTITVGRPEVNAATAFLANRVPTALVIEDVYRIQVDPELVDHNACIWGTDAERTETAVACFVERYLGDFLESLY